MQQYAAMPGTRAAGRAPASLVPVWLRRTTKLCLFFAVLGLVVAVGHLILPALQTSGAWGYVAGSLIQMVTAATIVIPIPGAAALTVMSQELNPMALAAAGAVGGTIGELTGYWVGTEGRGVLQRSRFFDLIQSQMDRRGGLVIALFALIPVLPMDAAGMMAGAAHYPVRRFLLAMFLGKLGMLLATFFIARGVVAWVM